MKNVILNLYNRDYFTFYIVCLLTDMLSVFLFKLPIVSLFIVFTMLILSTLTLAKKFKK